MGHGCVVVDAVGSCHGRSDKVVPLISELCVARESEGGSVIVILAEKEKEEMEMMRRTRVSLSSS